MARYIDAKYLGTCETCRHHGHGGCDTWCDHGECYQPNLSKIPTADVVEVVRCSECKYKDDCARQMVHTTRDYVLEQNISTYNKVDFCSYGERKIDNEQV